MCTLSSKRKQTDATNSPWKEDKKWEVIDQTAKLCQEPLSGFGQTKCKTLLMPSNGNKKNKDLADFLKRNHKKRQLLNPFFGLYVVKKALTSIPNDLHSLKVSQIQKSVWITLLFHEEVVKI